MKLNLDLDDLEKKAKSCESWDWFSENANLYDGSGGDFEIVFGSGDKVEVQGVNEGREITGEEIMSVVMNCKPSEVKDRLKESAAWEQFRRKK